VPLIYILAGPDDFSISQRLEEFKKDLDETMLAANFTQFPGEKVSPAELKAAVETVPFLAEKRLVVVTGLLGRFEAGGQKKAASRENDVRLFAGSLASGPESTLVILIDDKVAGSNPLLKALGQKARISQFPLLKGDELKVWIGERVQKSGGSIGPAAVNLLASLVGSNLWTMSGEVEKLVLYCAGRRIEEADVRTLVANARDVNIFALVDAILAPDAARAENLLEQMLAGGDTPSHLLNMLHRQLHLLVLARDMQSRKVPQAEMQSKLGLSAEFAFRKTLEQAKRYSVPRLKTALERLLETDIDIKTGKYGDELALNVLVAELGQSAL
jgi:DNA polymerase-3 subunit delta